MNKIVLEVIGLTHSLSLNEAFALVLADKKSNLKLPIIIGSVEAQSIALALEKYESRRPLTHDLFKNFADNYNINVKEVVIDRFREGVFYSQLVCEKDGEASVFDARTSDSVALALRFGCPIYTNQQVLDEAGVMIEEDENDDENHQDSDFEERSIEELKNMMEEAVEEEDYELASILRDEIKSKENK
ncbi:MAG: bifunctional nuclease family protein [Bacteroidales bacterium]|nr:bifunctional nuclease family protein [Bacteroidales bacterium]